ncbi:carboxymuconolactone decarboxylase family protein [Novosphingobium album (ex Hu et al. 2023)]|uniref:Carboxymuconolactone decarboxylase family protein n=1 Tax=Novosphingobium album (ex Hu et al. 2023) TaxID=2930093 RepID=A0ABT0B7K3_9SPHN|nr:carboxymuconolactone decarboxylase family protein [Novosphingobium album (ex Hu et al. 2023)]MCJ2181045.1 carboxymuconolactone decarboxylase family protein [Novosphingobium album (ex Hu et al. 2023)]
MDGFPHVTRDQLDPQQLEYWNELTTGPRGFYTGGPDTQRLPDLYNAWMQFPEFGMIMLQLGDAVRARKDLPGRLREIIVLVTSARLGAMVEFDFHVPFALNEGLTQNLIDALREGHEPPFADDAERATWEANLQLLDTATLTAEVRNRLIAAIGYPGLVELFATVMLYVVTAWTTNVARVKLAEDFSADPEKLKAFFSGKPIHSN